LQRYDLPPRAKKKRLPAMTPGRIDRFETDKSKSKEMDKSLSSTYLRGETGASVENEVKGENSQTDDEVAATLTTGEDAVSFFVKSGNQCPVKFVTLNRAETGNSFRPYDLKVVEPRHAHTDHFTMSMSGLVHVRPGVQTDFTPLSQWMRESSQFNVLSSIGTFKNYIVRKCYMAWMHNVRYKLYCGQRRKLAAHLFLGMESFCLPLLDIKRATLEMEQVVLIDSQGQKTYAIPHFVEHQTSKRAEATKKFELAMDKMQGTVQRVCTDVRNLAKKKDAYSGLSMYELNTVNEKTKSMQQIKKEEQDSKALVKRSENEARMLVDFIRLMDYMVVSHLVVHVLNTVDRFLIELLKIRKVGLFQTDIHFSDTTTSFSPDEADILQMVSQVLDATIVTVMQVSRIIYTQPFSSIMASIVTDGPNVGSIIRDSSRFIHLQSSIDTKIVKDFTEADDYAQTFDIVRPVYNFDTNWDFDEYSAREHSIATIKETMDTMINWETELDRMRVGGAMGILHVESRKLKNKLVPMNAEKMEQVKSLLNDLAREKCKVQLEENRHRIEVLELRPTHLNAFAQQLDKLNKLKLEVEAMNEQEQIVEDMYELLERYEVRVASQDNVQLDDLRDTKEQYVVEETAAAAYIEETQGEQTQSLDSSIARLREQAIHQTDVLTEGLFVDASKIDNPGEVLEELEIVKQKLANFNSLEGQYGEIQELFGESVTSLKDLKKCKAQFDEMFKLWDCLNRWQLGYDKWMNEDFTQHNWEEVNKEVQVFFKDAYGLDRKIGNAITAHLKDKTQMLKLKMGDILDLGNPKMRPRHWQKIFNALGKGYVEGQVFTLTELEGYDVYKISELVGEVSSAASGEAQLEESLAIVEKGWTDMEFITLNYREQADVFILGSLEDINMLLEDNQVTLQTMMGSRFIMGVQEEVEVWEKKLALLAETLDEWTACSRNWMYLETIFSAEDIQKQLPVEAQKFKIIDKLFRENMTRTSEDKKVIDCLAEGLNLLELFQNSNETLDQIQKSLEEYLETKRLAFPRFYFLSNDELLEILSQTRDPHAVQPFMTKCFDAMKSIRFNKTPGAEAEIEGMLDPIGEYVAFSTMVEAQGPVEYWLSAVEQEMRQALYDNMNKSWHEYPQGEDEVLPLPCPADNPALHRAGWFFEWPAAVSIAVDEIYWTRNLRDAIIKVEGGVLAEAVKLFLDFSIAQIGDMVTLVQGKLSKTQRSLMSALITIDVHGRDVVKTLVQNGVSGLSDFEWTRQLRYYWETEGEGVNKFGPEGECIARQTNTRFPYAYEFLGNTWRLVITPLTDLCYMTLTGAMHMKLGGAPAGPAGTGKTETTKDLAKALAIQCVVFNCSDGLDYKIMGRFFSGLAQCGAWACFDEFNRIDIEVLSVIAQQILCIQRAIVGKVDEFDFEGTMIPLNTNFGVFITMNPGYAGRTELPDNLQALFRPVAMMVPDYRMIAEIVLFSSGFVNAFPLSNKMQQLYALSSEQLSKQDHYDFGMRAVKTVLMCAAALKQKEPDTWEDLLLIRAMRDSNIPKFLEQDLPLFHGIVSDLFPGVEVPVVDYGKLQTAIEVTCDKNKLQKRAEFISKVIQIHEVQLVRHGMMVVGEAGSGKSKALLVLAQALGKLKTDGVEDRDGFFKICDELILNPKSISAGELYGQFNMMTGEWFDGIVPKLFRESVAAAEVNDNRKWIVFDGPVDAVWIENMNTVLDDNRMLCLANSERIKMAGTMHMVFEVMDLAVASPATVSRCGMVFMEQVHVGIYSLFSSWLEGQGQHLIEQIPETLPMVDELAKKHLIPAMEYMREFCMEKVLTSNLNLMQSFLNIFSSLVQQNECLDKDVNVEKVVRLYFVFALIWSIGGNVHDDTRPVFNKYCKEQFAELLPDEEYDPDGVAEDLYHVFIDKPTAKWVHWRTLKTEFHFNPKQSYFELLVPTTDTTCYRMLVHTLLPFGNPVLYMAETGVGKSVVMQSYLDEAVAETGKFVSHTMGYSAQTTPSNLKDIMEGKLDKKRKNLLGPPAGKQMLFFVDDLNMPALEIYGAQPPNELLRQMIDGGGFYDIAKLFFKNIQNIIFSACMAPPGGGRNEVTPRLLRHYNMMWMPQLSEESMKTIFSEILKGFLECEIPEIADVAHPMVASAVGIYKRVEKDMLPTPSKSHYTFNLRDLSKVFQGVLMVKHEYCPDKRELVKLWAHEEARVFRDRLIDQEDRDKFNSFMGDVIISELEMDDLPVEEFGDLLFGDYLTREDKAYQEVHSLTKLNDLLTEYLEEYNITFPSQMHLVFFHDAMSHISRISRVLRQPRGNALLVGVGGSGRQSLTRLASFMADCKCFSIEITRGYGMNEFHEDLKTVLMTAGCQNQPITFLFSDTQIVNEGFLEDINNILNTGEVPNLYAADELEKVVSLTRPLAKAAGKLETREGVLAHYNTLVRNNLHVVLAFSPIGAGFRNRCRMFPSLVNCCTIDWFNAWPAAALDSVAMRFLSEAKEELDIEEFLQPLCDMAVAIHRSVEEQTKVFFDDLKRYNYTTPTSYLELIKLYTEMMKKQRTDVMAKEARYRGGLKKLAETEVMVAGLQIELTKLQPVLVQASKDTDILLVSVAKDQIVADEQQAVVEKDVAAANIVAAEVKGKKESVQIDLDAALPAYYSAIKALDSLDKKSIQELKSFANPPKMVGVTLDAVCILFGVKQDWKEAKALMNDMKFLDRLKDYDKDNIEPAMIKKLRKFIDMPEFEAEQVAKVSAAAKSICLWVRAMFTYDQVAKTIAPKKAALEESEKALAIVMSTLDEKKSALQAVLDKVADLKRTLKAAEKKKDDLQTQAQATKDRLGRAIILIDSLGGEKGRWNTSADLLSDQMGKLVGNMILSAGCVAYLGPFTFQYRVKICAEWVILCNDLKIPVDPKYSLQATLAEPVTVRDWNMKGLPADEFSTENGLFATMGRRWPLMIDPQGQANKWVRNMQKDNNLQIIKLTEKDFLRALENAIRYGASVLLENVQEELDPALEPVLLKQIFKKGGQWLLHLGDTDVPYSPEFRFFITTKLANPHYMPEVCIKVTIINFTVTLTGLEDQLLVDVISNERPDLEQKNAELVLSIAGYKKNLKELEDKILHMLANSKGNILDDQELIDTLAASKITSEETNVAMVDAEKTQNEIKGIREKYRIVATRGSVIYFVIASLALVDPMYQYSLQFYAGLFRLRLKHATPEEDFTKRLEILMDDVTRNMFINICRGLFEAHKILYSFMIAVDIQKEQKEISELEWKIYLLGAGLCNKETLPDKPQGKEAKFLESGAPVIWEELWTMEEALPDIYGGLTADVKKKPGMWKVAMIDAALPHESELPAPWCKRLSNFQKMLVLRAFRPEKLVFGTRIYTGLQLGQMFTESPAFDLKGCYDDSTCKTPLIFVLSPGADINDYLLKLANEKEKDDNIKIISLGQGQGPIAEALMKGAKLSGDWVCLQNCHLSVSWLPAMEQIVEATFDEDPHPEYRLWLTSMPSNKFPVPVLQNGIKITNEPPKGIKANLARVFLEMQEEQYENAVHESKKRAFKKLVFGFAFFNAISLERRKYGALGWNIRYSWMNSDLKTGIMQVTNYVEDQEEVPYRTLNVMVAEVSYGGRVTDKMDKLCNMAIMSKYFTKELMNDEYRFDPAGVYFSPPQDEAGSGTLQDVRDYIATLPVDEAPEAFGMHPNADITYQQQLTKGVIDTIITMGGGGGGGGGGGAADSEVVDAAKGVEQRMPANFDPRKGHKDTFAMATRDSGEELPSVNSLGVFLGQEMSRFNTLIECMKATLYDLQRAIKGLIVMSGPLEEMYNAFVFQRIPPQWENAGYPCLKPLASWVEDFFGRIEHMGDWLVKGPRPVYWLSGYFFPQGFMTSVKQTYSRKYAFPVDLLTVGCEVMPYMKDQIVKPPTDGAYIYGMLMQGARFSTKTMKMAESIKNELFDPMPVIWLKPCKTSDYNPTSCYTCPMYKTSIRAGTLSTTGHSTNFVVQLHLPSDESENHWIRRGTAMLLMLDT
jgi:dynein heavy chain